MTRVHPDSQFQQHQIYDEHVRISLFRKEKRVCEESEFIKDLTDIYKSYKCDNFELMNCFFL
jgi:hypothetical protein